MFGLGMGEMVIIFLIVIVIFGANKLPALGDGLGKALNSFKRAIDSTKDDVDKAGTTKSVEPSAEKSAEGGKV